MSDEASESNPYQSPQRAEPLVSVPVAKRAIGLTVALILTPVATFIAFFATCTWNFYWDAQRLPPNAPRPYIELWRLPPLIVFGLISPWTLVLYLRQVRTRPSSSHPLSR